MAVARDLTSGRAVFLDRDGTIAPDVPYCSREEDFKLYPEAGPAIKLLKDSGFKVIVITNQSGIARGYFTEKTLDKIHNKLRREIKKFGIELDAIYYCPHHPDDGCDCRKPKTALFRKAAADLSIDLERSYVIGDMPLDVEAGRAVGCRTVLLATGTREADGSKDAADFVAADLAGGAGMIISALKNARVVTVDH